MTLSASFVWKNPDSTRDLNNRLRGLVHRGILTLPSTPFVGDITPAVGLTVQVRPLIAVSYDGMTVIESTFQTLPVLDGQKQYIVIRARYNEGGAPATPTLVWQVLSDVAYAGDPEKDYLIVVGTVDLALGALVVTQTDISYEERDEINQLGRDWYRGVVANPAGLPVPPPAMNVVGDFYFVQSDHTFHFWNGSIWEPLNTGSYNSETALMNKAMVDAEQQRFVNGSGVIAGSRPKNERDFASDLDIKLDLPSPSATPLIGFRSFSALVNGHRVQTYQSKGYVTLDPKPGIGERYDIVYLEVWREAITVPETFAYKRNPDGSTTYTLQEIDDKLEKLQWSGTSDTFDLNPVEPYAHAWRVVKWRFAAQQNMPSTACLYNPSDPTISGACTNLDGNPFTSEPAGTGTDDRIWVAPSVTASDGYSWAIPLYVVKRTSLEAFPTPIREFRDGVRYIFPVYPVVDVAHAAREALDTVHRSEPTPITFDHYPYDEPSGFLSGLDFQIETKAGSNNVSVYEDQAHVRVRGVEDWIRLSGGAQVALPTAPIGPNDWARQLVYLRMSVTLYDNGSGTSTARQFISQKHRPYIPSNIAGDVRGQGWKRGYVTFEYVYKDFGNTDYLDENDAMTAAGWTRGDLTMAAKNAQYEDGGIWSRAIPIDEDDRVHPYLCEWAVPVCLIHRRNQAAWGATTAPNGSGPSRPDGRTDFAWIYPQDLVDLRHGVGVQVGEVQALVEKSLEDAMRGQLRTRMANKYLGHGVSGEVAGTQILQSDFIGAVPGAYNMQPGDSIRRIWSDAREFHVVSASFDLFAGAPISTTLYDYSYDVGNNRGTLVIKSPPYAHLVRHTPAIVVANGNTASTDFLEFAGPPLWSSSVNYSDISPASAKYIDTSTATNELKDIPFYFAADQVTASSGVQGFLVTTKDTIGNATEMTGYIDTSTLTTGQAVLSWWVHYDRSFAAPYSNNFGLAEIPDEVHAVTLDPLGTKEQVHLGVIYTIVKKSLVAAAQIDITAADVSAASGLPGVITLMRLGSSIAHPGLATTSVTMSLTRDTITQHLSAPFTGDYEVEVFFKTTDVKKWMEVGRGGKSVQGYFEWAETSLNFGAEPAPAGNRAVDLGNAILTAPQLDNGEAVYPVCIWTKTVAGLEWTYSPGNFYSGANLVNFIYLNQNGLNQEALVITSVHQPLQVADTVQIDYTYTPYQGMSTDSGASPVVTPALIQSLKDVLHGEIVGNTDVVVTQSGAASYFSGVESWTGIPVNHNQPFASDALYSQRFEWYNSSAVVKPANAPPSALRLNGLLEARRNLLAAAVLRMPFPQNVGMVSGGYHDVVTDFDLDPCRAGVASGTMSYAPGYFGGPAYVVDKARNDQFVNGLSRLLEPGSVRGKAAKAAFMGAAWYPTGTHTAAVTVDKNSTRWYAGALEIISLQTPLPDSVDHLVKRVMVNKHGRLPEVFLADPGAVLSFGTSGIRVYDFKNRTNYTHVLPEPAAYLLDSGDSSVGGIAVQYLHTVYTNVITSQDWCVSIQPGAVLAHYKLFRDATSFATLLIAALRGSPDPVYIDETLVSYESLDAGSLAQGAGLLGSVTSHVSSNISDTVILPFGSVSHKDSTAQTSKVSGLTKFVGEMVEYPGAWSGPTVTALDGLFTAPSDSRGAGRGLYLGDSDSKFNMSVFVPGSGDSLRTMLLSTTVSALPEEAPHSFPYTAQVAPFEPTHKQYHKYDHGGQIAYSCFALGIKPTSDANKNRLVLQITGGPVGKLDGFSKLPVPEDLDGTAIDAFWPKGRPILKSKK